MTPRREEIGEQELTEEPFYNYASSVMPVSPASISPLQKLGTPGETNPADMQQMAIGPSDTDAHTHTGWTNSSGNGYTSTDHGAGNNPSGAHNHPINNYRVGPGPDGHNHNLIDRDVPEPSLKFPVSYDNFTRSREL